MFKTQGIGQIYKEEGVAWIELKKNQNNFWIFLIWGWDTVGLCASITVITVSSETALLFVTEKYNK